MFIGIHCDSTGDTIYIYRLEDDSISHDRTLVEIANSTIDHGRNDNSDESFKRI